MNILQLIKSKKRKTRDNIISWLFILCGGKLYFDYVLITNPVSKNPLIKLLWGWVSYGEDIRERIGFGYVLFGIHFIMCVINFLVGMGLSWGNILGNIYPMVVQMYIMYRCYSILSRRNYRLNN